MFEDDIVIEDWAKIKAYREALPWASTPDNLILSRWTSDSTQSMIALARRIQRDDTPPPPPVSQEVLIWRETWARYCDKYDPALAKEYREGLRDSSVDDTIVKKAIKLALKGFGKEQASG